MSDALFLLFPSNYGENNTPAESKAHKTEAVVARKPTAAYVHKNSVIMLSTRLNNS